MGVKISPSNAPNPRKKRQILFMQFNFGQNLNALDLICVSRAHTGAKSHPRVRCLCESGRYPGPTKERRESL